MNFAILVGAVIGLATAGPLSDWISARSTRKNNGIREPEMRLPAMIPYVIIMYIGNIVVSVGYDRHWPWEAIVLVGFTCAGIQVRLPKPDDHITQSLDYIYSYECRLRPSRPSSPHMLSTATSLWLDLSSSASPSTRMFGVTVLASSSRHGRWRLDLSPRS